MFGPVSGGHFNPVVSLVDASFGGLSWRDALAYVPAQVAGCILGAIVANGMFALAAISISTQHRATPAHLLRRDDRHARPDARDLLARPDQTRRTSRPPPSAPTSAPRTSSPARRASPTRRSAIGRMFSNTFAGIAPASVPGFVVAQLIGGVVAIGVHPGPLPRHHARRGRRRGAAAHRRRRPRRRGRRRHRERQGVGGERAVRPVAIGGSDAGISAALRTQTWTHLSAPLTFVGVRGAPAT